jgi:hypothetical protein
MTTLSIGRLTATVPRPPGEPDPGRQVEGMLAGATGQPLDRALDAQPLPAGHWFLPRLDLRLALDLHRAGPGTEQQWADAIALALQEAMLSGQALHYGSECDALADLIASAAVGRFDNEWAWRELGLVDDGAVSGSTAHVVLVACGRHPEYALAATITAVRRTGTGAVHRMLGSSGWLELAGLVYRVHTGRPVPSWLAAAATAGRATAADDARIGPGPESAVSGTAASETAGRIARIADGELARCFRRARLRPDPGAVLAWAVLAAAETEPGLLMLAGAEPAVRQLAAALRPGGVPPVQVRGRTDRRTAVGPRGSAADGFAVGVAADGAAANRATGDAADAGHGTIGGHDAVDAVSGSTGPAAASPSANATSAGRSLNPDRAAKTAATAVRRDARQAGPADEPGSSDGLRPGWPSDWAGLLHLYQTAAEADIPAAVLADEALSARPLAWVLHSIADALVPAAPDDPALLAFAGLVPTDEPPLLAWRSASQPELDSVARHAHRWLAVAAFRLLGDGEATAQTVERLLHRSGIIVAERGWVDVQMPLDTVDIDIRRAGLDIDPGWIGWLGSVVRFCYV